MYGLRYSYIRIKDQQFNLNIVKISEIFQLIKMLDDFMVNNFYGVISCDETFSFHIQ